MKKNHAKKKYTPSIFQLSAFVCFQVLQTISFKWASTLAYHFWFHPGRSVVKRIALFKPENSQTGQLNIADKSVQYWSAGQGPRVLLVHGWASIGSQFAVLAQALLRSGFQVIWFDAPAHGRSSGMKTSVFEVAACIAKLEAETGSFEAIIAHSFGTPCSLMAISEGLNVNKFIAISPPSSAQILVDKYCRAMKAHPKTRAFMVDRLHKAFGDDVFDRISAKNLALKTVVESLVIHDKGDSVVPFEEGRVVQKNLVNSNMLVTEGLGHNRILRDKGVIKSCVDFILVS